jgi:hypothetical protein
MDVANISIVGLLPSVRVGLANRHTLVLQAVLICYVLSSTRDHNVNSWDKIQFFFRRGHPLGRARLYINRRRPIAAAGRQVHQR